MKLRNLKGAIRKHSGAVRTGVPTIAGTMNVALMKTELLAALDETFGDGMTETGITLQDGFLRIDRDVPDLPHVYLTNGDPDAIGAEGVARGPGVMPSAAPASAEDADDLLDDDADLLDSVDDEAADLLAD